MRKYLLLLFICYAGIVNAAYNPTLTVDKYIETLKVNKDATIEQTIESLVTINTQKGIETEGQQSITYNSKLETVRLVEAYTLQPNGKKIEVPESAIKIRDDSDSDGAPMFTTVKRYVVIYPEVKIGSKLYYKFKSFQHTPDFKDEFFKSHYFSPHYQYKSVVEKLEIHKSLIAAFDTKGMTGGFIKESNGYKQYQYIFKQNNVHIVEPSQTALEDFAPYFNVSTFKNYEDFAQAYEIGLDHKTSVTPAIQKLANNLTKGIKDNPSKVRAIHNWVSKNIRYVAVYLGNGGVVPHDAETILNNLYGDCKDHAVLLEALLKAVNIESTSALINLGDAYSLPKLPVMSPFNHVINYIPSLDLYLDSTAQYAGVGILPSEDMDKPVLLTKLKKIGHTPQFDSNQNMISNVHELVIHEDGSITGKAYNYAKGYFDVDYRQLRANNLDDDEDALVSRRLSTVGESGRGKIESVDPKDLDSRFLEKNSYKLDPVSNFPGPGALKIPFGLAFNMLPRLAKHKPIEKLDFPAYCYSFTIEDIYTIKFPPKSTITRIPDNVEYRGGVIKYEATYKKNGQKILVNRRYIQQVPRAICGNKENEEDKAAFKALQRDLRSQVFYE